MQPQKTNTTPNFPVPRPSVVKSALASAQIEGIVMTEKELWETIEQYKEVFQKHFSETRYFRNQ